MIFDFTIMPNDLLPSVLMLEFFFSLCTTSYNPKMDFNRRFGSISRTLFYILSAENE